MIEGLLFDIDGVMVTSWRPLPGAVEALERVRHLPRMFLTNTTSKSRSQVAELLAECGFDVAEHEILTAAKLTADYVGRKYQDKRVWVLNEGPIAQDMEELHLVDGDDPDVVVLGGAGACFTHATLSRVLELMLDGVPVVAMHRSMTWSTAQGLRIDTGVYLEGLEKAAGRSIEAIGKPSPLGFSAALGAMGPSKVEPPEASSVLMVGDDLRNDVLGAQAAGLVGALVRTGKFRADQLEAQAQDDFAPVPAHVLDSVADLPDLLADLNGTR